MVNCPRCVPITYFWMYVKKQFWGHITNVIDTDNTWKQNNEKINNRDRKFKRLKYGSKYKIFGQICNPSIVQHIVLYFLYHNHMKLVIYSPGIPFTSR